MSYDHRLVFESVSHELRRSPKSSLRDLSQRLHVSCRTIQNAVNAVTGKKFRDLRDKVLFSMVKQLLASAPTTPIRRISLEAGYKSSRSFARALRRACGTSPRQLPSRIAHELLTSEAARPFPVVPH